MCGPFARDLRDAPAGFIKHLQQQQLLQQLQPPTVVHGTACDGFLAQGMPLDTPMTSDVGLELPQKYEHDPIPELCSDDGSFFNWSLLDEAFQTDLSPPLSSSPSPSATTNPSPTGSPELVSFQSSPVSEFPQDLAAVVSAPPSQTSLPDLSKSATHANPEVKRPLAKAKRSSKAVSKPPSDSDRSDGDEHEGNSQPYSEKLPKELLDHPCAATLLSAGIRIKGRTREELLEVAERIKKRRRASAARCRARKASHVHTLEDENEQLKEENMMLRRRIAELTGGASVDFSNILMDSNGGSIGIPIASPVY
mmetsp:Transcript_38483/g.108767  ORF Transcript_38483/g.108767 Transcript_38483/m.108767 type:complete len:309 (+) Transcript_38483:327-1253(+)|eukprot:CAMPEP_0117669144 /NCGR_PEP_ID=MMETSP0804-20121206/11953_1 /TAXON_ID=1074897 /ORGANISM="Tetraselmis astigmatica, Strain CCMP880" /LENGTH=308 /DNA_ID=CAMNT_0005477137 /DNA_START=305 /DNA_END=1231 /DNA_ORIENTATION=-